MFNCTNVIMTRSSIKITLVVSTTVVQKIGELNIISSNLIDTENIKKNFLNWLQKKT